MSMGLPGKVDEIINAMRDFPGPYLCVTRFKQLAYY
jgi:hypothetical protein